MVIGRFRLAAADREAEALPVQDGSLRRMHALIIEDEWFIVDTIEAALRELG
jgi:hypothetical protein